MRSIQRLYGHEHVEPFYRWFKLRMGEHGKIAPTLLAQGNMRRREIMTRRDKIEKDRDLKRWREREAKRLAQLKAERRAALMTETLAWCQSVLQRNRQLGLQD